MEEQQPSPGKGFWKQLGSAVASPATAFSRMTKESPAVTLIAILLVVQPVVQTGIELIKGLMEVKQDLDPQTRPVTKAELDIVNQKIDFNNQLILAGIKAEVKRNGTAAPHAAPNPNDYTALQDKLIAIQKPLDSDFAKAKK